MSSINFAFDYQRLSRSPLDNSSVFPDMAAFENYLLTGPAYAGQILAVRNLTNIPSVFRINEDFTYDLFGGNAGDVASLIAAHNEDLLSHPEIQAVLNGIDEIIAALVARVDGLESLGSWAGTFDTYAVVPENISDFPNLTANDYIYVRTDEKHDGLYSRYFVDAIDSDGDITWGFDRVWGESDATAETVTMGNQLTVSNPIGGFKAGDSLTNDDNVWGFIKKILNPRVAPAYAMPTLTLSGSQPLNQEIGSNVTPTLTPTWDQNDGGAIEEYRLSKGGTVIFTDSQASVHTDATFQLTVPVTYNASVDYDQGAIKNDSESNPDPTNRIESGTRASGNVTYTPQRCGFYGPLMSGAIPSDSTIVRALPSNVLNPNTNTVMVADVPSGGRGCCFAYPSTLRAPTSIIQRGLGVDVKAGFAEIAVSVNGANDYDAASYRVVYLITEFPFTGEGERFTLTI